MKKKMIVIAALLASTALPALAQEDGVMVRSSLAYTEISDPTDSFGGFGLKMEVEGNLDMGQDFLHYSMDGTTADIDGASFGEANALVAYQFGVWDGVTVGPSARYGYLTLGGLDIDRAFVGARGNVDFSDMISGSLEIGSDVDDFGDEFFAKAGMNIHMTDTIGMNAAISHMSEFDLYQYEVSGDYKIGRKSYLTGGIIYSDDSAETAGINRLTVSAGLGFKF